MIKQLCIIISNYFKKIFNYKGNYEDGPYDNGDSNDETELTCFIEEPDKVIHPYNEEACVIFHNKLKYNKLAQTSGSLSPISNEDEADGDNNDISHLENDGLEKYSNVCNTDIIEHVNIVSGLTEDLLVTVNDFIVFNNSENNSENNSKTEIKHDDDDDNVSNTSLDVFEDSLEI